ncbi:unnamed protein product [Urochloa humidicola]
MCIQVMGSYASVIVADGDSVLLDVGCHEYDKEPDYFVYSAGACATVPPSLYLLPPCYHAAENGKSDGYLSDSPRGNKGPKQQYLDQDATGLVRRGKDDFVVASLLNVSELLLLRNGEWSVTPVSIGHGKGSKDEELQLSWWGTHSVISVGGDGLLCFLQFGQGLVFTNVFDETPVFWRVPFPPTYEMVDSPRKCRGSSQDVCATSDGTVKLVSVYPRCCCDSSGATHCRHSSNAYIIKTWTLKMDDMKWVMDGMVDATELWALDAYKRLPHVQLAHPIVSLEDPNVIFFMVCERFNKRKRSHKNDRLILVDMKSKTLRSVCRYDGRSFIPGRIFFPSSVSDYFNSSRIWSVAKRGVDSEPPLLVIANQKLSDNTANLKVTSPGETILAALQEVPSLAREDVLKAYSILSHDSNGRRFRSLLGLPLSMRKDWLLMEIKTSEACSVCSACTANS